MAVARADSFVYLFCTSLNQNQMSRIVTAIPKGMRTRAASAQQPTPTQEYLERVAKYVPAEIVIAYTSVNGVLTTVPEHIKPWALWGNLLICWIFTPIYLKLAATPADKDALPTQQIVSSIAFIVWAYSVGQEAVFGEGYIAGIAAAVLILFSLISGRIVPKPKTVPLTT